MVEFSLIKGIRKIDFKDRKISQIHQLFLSIFLT